MECWVSVEGHEGRYEVSDLGRVRSVRFVNGKVDRLRGRPLVLSSVDDGRGYPIVSLARDGGVATKRVHTLVASAFLGPRPAGMEVRHIDGDRANARLTNLAYGTRVENEADKAAHGTRLRGGSVHGATLTEGAVRAILATYRRGSIEFGSPALGRRFGCSGAAVLGVISGRTWAHIDRSPYDVQRTGWATKDAALKGVEATCVVCGASFRRPRNRERPITCSAICRRERKSLMSRRRHELGVFGGEEA